ncbi:hypothetical protein [uncultured Massilia sp.]|uniref:hypothetical protein n=1 Tax=uncultured Massilia sp. TaxID=169973 RepID=UPI00258C5467|nr:hypothetical protein [uncultured Massilia sp.]
MSQITLVVPFLLPLPEFAPDLVRALQAPALSALLGRTSNAARSGQQHPNALPHESWLARELGLAQDGRPAFAAAAMRGFGLDPADDAWFIVNPAHVQIARSHLMLGDLRQLGLREDEGRALFEAARPLCDEIGHPLLYGDAGTWFLRAGDWVDVDPATPDTVVGMDLTDFVPRGQAALAFRKLQNEVQMAWHTHPVNAAGRVPVNSFWLWGASRASARKNGQLAAVSAPGWISGLSDPIWDGFDRLDTLYGYDATLIVGSLAEAALAADWGTWLLQVQELEQQLFAPLLGALTQGRIKSLRIVASSREGLAEFTTTAMAQRKFWRRPTLEALT